MLLAKGFACFGHKRLSFKRHLTGSAVEALCVEVLAHGLHPSVPRLNREFTARTHGLEHGRPVFLTVGFSLLNVELVSTNGLLALHAQEAFRVPCCLHGIDTLPNNCAIALFAVGSQILLVVIFAVQVATILHKANVDQLDATLRVGAHKVVRTPAVA